MIYNTFAISNNDTIIIKSEMTKYQLLNQVFNILNEASNDKLTIDNDKLTIDITIVTADNRYMTEAGKHYCSNKALKYIIDNYDNQFSNYSLFVINTVNHIYIVCPGSF